MNKNERYYNIGSARFIYPIWVFILYENNAAMSYGMREVLLFKRKKYSFAEFCVQQRYDTFILLFPPCTNSHTFRNSSQCVD